MSPRLLRCNRPPGLAFPLARLPSSSTLAGAGALVRCGGNSARKQSWRLRARATAFDGREDASRGSQGAGTTSGSIAGTGTGTDAGAGSPGPAAVAAGGAAADEEYAAGEDGTEVCQPPVPCYPKKPHPLLTAHEVVVAQLEALKGVLHPNGDLQLPHHGLEVLYSFADIDPFNKGSTYFGKRLNVAYFSQFSAKFSLSQFRPLLGMREYIIISSLYVSQSEFIARVGVRAAPGTNTPAVFLFHLLRKDAGHLKGCWVTTSLRREEEEEEGRE